ncbi:hypothetical protein A3C89_03480 [Candidatus Kaiserbacteria bacterium RIFCSPHIGHO2_02_FULL_50_50]|uniref:Glycosyl transferase family 1 domain-containing protein n=1 Tax=Candidatus Kaiserbacteria bacterium RIFCSPHIGHO2_02_FULL_50_50 TaxID=1798492 RepID=A0A1F6DC34_9BACT|nr:MAG: hypothetical protein A3C89_03480 [Candidatus Kaiserbacteria bacterium RIFCSPHIGHO2_02_FULL_50_50]OGG88522.1 MAG: hypothetical protein A3G62_03370 [Candidatus Kaiserbacteria bacterium RIFCSPLOWO2_12_FULL_50_10]
MSIYILMHSKKAISDNPLTQILPASSPRNSIQGGGLKIAMIHNEKRIATGAHHINELMMHALVQHGAKVRNFFPRIQLTNTPIRMRGLSSILFFHSLLERKNEILRHHIIQGTTYTPLPFLSFNTPIVSHFGSTTAGFLTDTPKTSKLLPSERAIWRELCNLDIIPEMELQTFQPLRDIADMEELVATQVTRCIATSERVRTELIGMGVLPEKIKVIHNAIEDYWFNRQDAPPLSPPHIVFLGRLGGDVFTLKLKGLDRLIALYRSFPNVPKITICMTTNKKLREWLRVAFPLHQLHTNTRKDLIPNLLTRYYGSILFVTSRYEGFSLSLVEGMSQGLVPISYAVGVAPEIIENGVNGFVVSSSDEAQEKVSYLLANPNQRLAMAAAAQKTAERFRGNKIANKLLALYHEILAS